ncbi:MAG: 7TM diverse intracellular signaling domain-containing protein [Ketobacteraceae bacterium]|nr:7TM diverse intracellular signaling domain-containing protein [Ketobacteraceae bacterium]
MLTPCIFVRLSLLLLALIAGGSVHARSLDVAEPGNQNTLVTRYFEYLEDPAARLSIGDLLSQSDLGWNSIERPAISFGFTHSAYWFRAELHNSSARQQSFLLDIANPKLSRAELYIVNPDNDIRPLPDAHIILATDSVLNREVPHRHPVFSLSLRGGERVSVYLRLENRFAMAVPVKLWQPAQFSYHNKRYMLYQGAYFGCMMAMLIYNVFIFFSTKSRSFAYYVLFVASLIVFSVIDRGFGAEYLWNGNEDLNFKLYVTFVAVSVALATGFARVYLTTDEYSPGYNRGLKIVEALSWGLALLALAAPSVEVIFAVVAVMLLAGLLVILSALHVLRRGVVVAKFYLMAWSVIIVGGVTHVFGNFGIVPFSSLTEHMLQISNMIEAMLLSFGLAYRINLLKAEKENAHIQAIQARENVLREKEINEAKNQFFASMSHEFRTPLTAILGYSELAQSSDISGKEQREHIKTIHQGAQHMLHLINDILDLSKIEAQKMEIEVITVDVCALCDEVRNMTRVLAESKQIYFRIEYDFPIPKAIQTDPTRLKQALINLSSNAVKFTQEGGVTLKVSYRTRDNLLAFSVIDTGIGISDEAREQLFVPFTQADSSTARKYGGTGLGLYLSKEIANRLGGDITVDSELGKGSTFTISVDIGEVESLEWLHEPAVQPEGEMTDADKQKESSANAEERPQGQRKKRILVVDDNPVNSKLLLFHLKKSGAWVTCASDGVEAIAGVFNESVDLVFMDIEMPVMDGVTAIRLLRAKGVNIPVYALTGNVDEESTERFLQAGFNGCLGKPYDMEKIEGCVRSL